MNVLKSHLEPLHLNSSISLRIAWEDPRNVKIYSRSSYKETLFSSYKQLVLHKPLDRKQQTTQL